MTAKEADLAARYGIVSPYPEDLTIPSPELFPDKPAYVVREQGGERVLNTMFWGFPHKVPGKRIDKASGKPILLDKKVTNVPELHVVVLEERTCESGAPLPGTVHRVQRVRTWPCRQQAASLVRRA